MLFGVLSVCALVCVCSAAPAPGCRWMEVKFNQYSAASFKLLDAMARNFTNTTEETEEMMPSFPGDLYDQAAQASPRDRVMFVVQVLEELFNMFEGSSSSPLWEDKTLQDFLNLINQQVEGLRSCHRDRVINTNKELQGYFQSISTQVLEPLGHSSDAWEMVRRETKMHLFRAEKLISSLNAK